MSRTLVLVRHGQSEWNLKNLFTGWRDVDLTEQGTAEAKAAGQRLKASRLQPSPVGRARRSCGMPAQVAAGASNWRGERPLSSASS